MATPRELRPAPIRRILPPIVAPTCFYHLPAEIRIEIYRLALEKTIVFILPAAKPNHHPHPLVRTSRQIRNEVLPILHSECRIKAKITDFDFTGMLHWMQRIPPDQEEKLCKNTRLSVELTTTHPESKLHPSASLANTASLRKWLHTRADTHRPQPPWKYTGNKPDNRTTYDMRRRARRTSKPKEAAELFVMLKAIGVTAQSGSRDGSNEASE